MANSLPNWRKAGESVAAAIRAEFQDQEQAEDCCQVLNAMFETLAAFQEFSADDWETLRRALKSYDEWTEWERLLGEQMMQEARDDA